ncbi:DNA polymerase beta subunit protein [Rhizobium phage RHph_X3_2]|nr:DNA polymerase beta subunit protein [Rhizobium phage RHph_X3_2]
MLDDLRFVAAAVAKKDYVADLTHLHIAEGRVTGYNGRMALSSSIDIAFDVRPRAAAFLQAVRACQGPIALTLTPAGRLSVRSGKFRSHVEALATDDGNFSPTPSGESVDLGDTFLEGLRLLSPLMGIDASRPWSMGIRLSNSSMYATNNVMVGEFWHGANMPLDAIIPAQAVDQLLRIGETPTRVQVDENSASFWFGDKRWLWTALIDPAQWPDEKITHVLSVSERGNQWPITDAFKEAVTALKPFLGDTSTMYVYPDRLATSTEEEVGSSMELEIDPEAPLQAYAHKQLEILCQVATSVNWRAYPAPAMFMAERLRGVVVGQRL